MNLFKTTRWILLSVAILGGVAGIVIGSLSYLYNRTYVYHCTDLRTKLPVAYKVRGFGVFKDSGWIEANAHDRDGQIYVFSGPLSAYTPFGESYFYRPHMSKIAFGDKYIVYLDKVTRSFSVSELNDKGWENEVLYSGTCETSI